MWETLRVNSLVTAGRQVVFRRGSGGERKLAYGIVRQTQHEIGERVVGKGKLCHAHPEVVRTSLTVPIIPSGAFPGSESEHAAKISSRSEEKHIQTDKGEIPVCMLVPSAPGMKGLFLVQLLDVLGLLVGPFQGHRLDPLDRRPDLDRLVHLLFDFLLQL